MPAEKEIPVPPPRARTSIRPIATLTIALASGLIFWFPMVNSWLFYDRDRILHGQIWRAWTGNLVHFSSSHYLWNLIIFAAAGSWLEVIRPRSARWFYLACPPVIAATLLLGEPTLQIYAGLSGLASGALVFLALVQLSENDAEPTWLWVAVFGMVMVKIALETVTGAPLLVHDYAGFRVVPLAHITGGCCGVLAWAITRQTQRVVPATTVTS